MPDDHASSPEPLSPDGETAERRVRVLLPLPLSEALDYLADEGAPLPEPGTFVRVPLGRRNLIGVVWDGAAGDDLRLELLKPVLEILPAPALRPELRRFIERVAAYTMAPPGAVLRMAMSVPEALQAPRPRRLCAASLAGIAALAEATSRWASDRRRAGECSSGCATGPPMNGRRAGPARRVRRRRRSRSPCRGPRRRAVRHRPNRASSPRPTGACPGPSLSPDQSAAAQRLVGKCQAGGFAVTVLDGVTGSGKTETYFAAIAAALAAGRQVLVLLPEIALGAQWLGRFRERFGVLPGQWHSDIRQAERRDTWRAVAGGQARVVVGARSALFLPFRELGLIVVDEEHDPSYKQEDGVCYQARDMAVLRASLAGIPIILVSATPSLETIVNVGRGRYGGSPCRAAMLQPSCPRYGSSICGASGSSAGDFSPRSSSASSPRRSRPASRRSSF